MISTIKKRMSDEKGFTLIEMLIVIIILGILLAIAVPAYLKFKDRANNSAAQANIRAAVPAIEAYNADNNGYASMTLPLLQANYDSAIKGITFGTITNTSYCVQSIVGNATYNKNGPGADIVAGACP